MKLEDIARDFASCQEEFITIIFGEHTEFLNEYARMYGENDKNQNRKNAMFIEYLRTLGYRPLSERIQNKYKPSDKVIDNYKPKKGDKK